MGKLQNPFPYIRGQKKKSNISMPCPLCGRDSVIAISHHTIPFLTVECPNCIRYALREDFFESFDDAEHAYLISGELCHTQENMTVHLVSAEAADEMIERQLKLESEDRSMAYLVWHYDQKDGGWNGWREYIALPAVAYCKDETDLKRITEKVVSYGYMEEKEGRYKPTIAGMMFYESKYRKENEMLLGGESNNKKVFIVHGRDTARRQEIENILLRAGLTPVVLAEEASRGMTIIEKIENYADVAFAIVLYTACDRGKYKDDKTLKPRARQNVVFEHGYMAAHLGRDHVVALVEDGVETPGDLSGVVYISLSTQNWKDELFKEMRAAGIELQS